MTFRSRLLPMTLLLAVAFDATALTCATDIDLTGYDKVLVPRGHGRVQNVSAILDALYPSHKQNMQFLLFFNTDSTTAKYVQTKDSAANVTRWKIFTEDGTGKRKLSICTYADTAPNTANGSLIVDDLTIDHDKPWLAAAEKYKDWAFSQSWAKRKSSKIDSAKFIALAASPYLYYQQENILKPLLPLFTDAYTSAANPATATWMTQWRSTGFDYDYPQYRYGSTTDAGRFDQQLSWLKGKDSVPLPYINAQLWDQHMTDPDGDVAHAYSDDNMVKNSLGQIAKYQACPYPSSGHCLVYACPSTTVWQDIILGARNDYLKDSDSEKSAGVYYDVLASAEPQMCADPSHDHDADDPQMWKESYRALLANTDGVIMAEGFAEVYLDLVDVFMMHQETEQPSDAPFVSISTVPLWNAVYGTISRSAGWNVNQLTQSPTAMLVELKKANSFGSRTWGSPWLTPNETTHGNALTYQAKLADTSDTNPAHARYQDVLAMMATAPLPKEDGAAGTTRWAATGNVSNGADADYGKDVIEFNGSGVAYTTPNWTGTAAYTQARWSMKRSASAMYVGFKVSTVSNGTVYLYYTNNSSTYTYKAPGSTSPYYTYHGVGKAPSADGWQTFDRDLQADLVDFFPGDEITAVQGFLMFNNPGKVVDIKLFKHPNY